MVGHSGLSGCPCGSTAGGWALLKASRRASQLVLSLGHKARRLRSDMAKCIAAAAAAVGADNMALLSPSPLQQSQVVKVSSIGSLKQPKALRRRSRHSCTITAQALGEGHAADQAATFTPAPKPVDRKGAVNRALVAERVGGAEVRQQERYPGYASWNTVKQPRWEGELELQGAIPKWLSGTYIRNGPGSWNAGDMEFEHLFDGYSTLVRLHFDNGKLVCGHAQLQSEAYKQATSNHRPMYREFKVVPEAGNVFQRIGELAGMATGHSLTDNANTGVILLGDGRVLCLTETMKGTIQIDPNTLETLGKFTYEDGFQGILHSAHPYVDDKEFITLLPDLIHPGYNVVRMPAGSNTREMIGRVQCRGKGPPGWVHSFAVSENYIVVPEMPLRYSAMNLLKSAPCPYYKFEWLPDSGSYMHILNRKTGALEASVEVPPFVTFHFINAYEEPAEDGKPARVIVDCCEHNANPTILQRLELHELRSFPGKVLPDARVGRFTIPLDGSSKGTLEAAVPPDVHGRGLDMNTINESFKSRKYRYLYAAGAHRPCNFPNNLAKVDLVDKSAKTWYHDGGIPTEPFFVPRPGAIGEDDGVVISLVSDDSGGGFVVLLDGQTFEELARGILPYGLPYGLHGCWVPSN